MELKKKKLRSWQEGQAGGRDSGVRADLWHLDYLCCGMELVALAFFLMVGMVCSLTLAGILGWS